MKYKFKNNMSLIENEETIIINPLTYNRYGWKKDETDTRDFTFIRPENKVLPRSFSLHDKMPPVLNQGKLGSCTANGICNCIRMLEMKEEIDTRPRSRLFVYYNERDIEGTTGEDAGAQIRDGIKSINTLGSCYEDTWPYDISQFTERPSEPAYCEAKYHKTLKYERIVQTIDNIKHALFSGYPIVFGFVVFDSIEKQTVSRSGIIPIPSRADKQIGGHCIICVGWNDSRRLFTIQNSWGEEWGDNGYGYMSYDYLTNPDLSSDFWIITFVK